MSDRERLLCTSITIWRLCFVQSYTCKSNPSAHCFVLFVIWIYALSEICNFVDLEDVVWKSHAINFPLICEYCASYCRWKKNKTSFNCNVLRVENVNWFFVETYFHCNLNFFSIYIKFGFFFRFGDCWTWPQHLLFIFYAVFVFTYITNYISSSCKYSFFHVAILLTKGLNHS